VFRGEGTSGRPCLITPAFYAEPWVLCPVTMLLESRRSLNALTLLDSSSACKTRLALACCYDPNLKLLDMLHYANVP
jgi:hypothetical protein